MQPASIVVLTHIAEIDATVPRPLVVRQPLEASHTQAQRGRPTLLHRIRPIQFSTPVDRINRINTIDRTGATPRPEGVLLVDPIAVENGTATTDHAATERPFRPIRSRWPTTPMSTGW